MPSFIKNVLLYVIVPPCEMDPWNPDIYGFVVSQRALVLWLVVNLSSEA